MPRLAPGERHRPQVKQTCGAVAFFCPNTTEWLAMPKGNHPFSGAGGSALRDRFAADLFAAQLGKCALCQSPIPPSLRGRRGKSSAVVDHIRPWRLRPDLARDQSNLWLVCYSCHATTCQQIEAAFGSDDDMIAEAKQRAAEQW